MSQCPLARNEDLVVEPLDDELLVFDSRADRAHSLNASAAAVWRACDGTRDRDELAAACELDPLAVDLALENLAGCDLLIDFVAALDTPRISRRSILRRVAVTGVGLGVALPVIRSIAAPSAQAAANSGRACGYIGPDDAAVFCSGTSTSASKHSYCTSHGSCRPGSIDSHVGSAACNSESNPCEYLRSCVDGHCHSTGLDPAARAFRRR